MTCMYCHASDHDIEDCMTLLGKIQEKRNQNNQNVQWISAKARDERRSINIVTLEALKHEMTKDNKSLYNTNG